MGLDLFGLMAFEANYSMDGWEETTDSSDDQEEVKKPETTKKFTKLDFFALLKRIENNCQLLNADDLAGLPADIKLRYDTPIVGKHLKTNASIYSKGNVVLKDCPKLGDIYSKGIVILIGCPKHGRITARKDLHAYDSNIHDLFSGKNLYIYNTAFPPPIEDASVPTKKNTSVPPKDNASILPKNYTAMALKKRYHRTRSTLEGIQELTE